MPRGHTDRNARLSRIDTALDRDQWQEWDNAELVTATTVAAADLAAIAARWREAEREWQRVTWEFRERRI